MYGTSLNSFSGHTNLACRGKKSIEKKQIYNFQKFRKIVCLFFQSSDYPAYEILLSRQDTIPSDDRFFFLFSLIENDEKKTV